MGDLKDTTIQKFSQIKKYMRAGAGPVEPVPLRAVHPHGDLPTRVQGDALQAWLQVYTVVIK